MIDTERLIFVGHLNSYTAPSVYSPLVIIITQWDRKGLTNIDVISYIHVFLHQYLILRDLGCAEARCYVQYTRPGMCPIVFFSTWHM